MLVRRQLRSIHSRVFVLTSLISLTTRTLSKLKNGWKKENKELELNCKYIVVFEFGYLTLDTILKQASRSFCVWLAKAAYSLHDSGFINGDLKPIYIGTVGSKMNLIELDVSNKICEKNPSLRFCPPEIVSLLSRATCNYWIQVLDRLVFSCGDSVQSWNRPIALANRSGWQSH